MLQGKRAALPSATIMIRQPIQRFQQMQASDIDIYRNEIRKTNANIVRPPARCSVLNCVLPMLFLKRDWQRDFVPSCSTLATSVHLIQSISRPNM